MKDTYFKITCVEGAGIRIIGSSKENEEFNLFLNDISINTEKTNHKCAEITVNSDQIDILVNHLRDHKK